MSKGDQKTVVGAPAYAARAKTEARRHGTMEPMPNMTDAKSP